MKAALALLQAGACVNFPNNEDVTPLHCGNPLVHLEANSINGLYLFTAASKGNSEMVALLLDNGANPNLPDYGLYTPLHEAAIEVKKFLKINPM